MITEVCGCGHLMSEHVGYAGCLHREQALTGWRAKRSPREYFISPRTRVAHCPCMIPRPL